MAWARTIPGVELVRIVLPAIVLVLVGVAVFMTQTWFLAIPLLIVAGAVALTKRNTERALRGAAPMGRLDGFRKGLAAIPLYLMAVGVGHFALAMVLYDRTTGLARDGQAFSGTYVLGVGFFLLGLVAAPFVIPAERDARGVLRGALSAFSVAALVVADTASSGYQIGGVAGELHCIVEQGREICPPGDGTWIMDARPDVFVMLLAVIAAYGLSHILARIGQQMPPRVTATTQA